MDDVVPSERELRAMAVLGAEPRAVQRVGEPLEMTRQGAHELLTRLRDRGLVRRETVDETHRYELARRPIVVDREIVQRPGRAKVFVCLRFTDA